MSIFPDAPHDASPPTPASYTKGSRRPNFFLVGAPKSGTTALAHYLSEHPQIFVSNPKEPYYFADDFHGLPGPKTEREYLDLFSRADEGCVALGEATTVYLYSSAAANRIKDFAPNARILVMLRNPLEIAAAYHAEHLYSLSENEPDFETAWRLRDARARGEALPPLVMEPKLIQYRDVAMLGEQMERLYRVFDREQVRVIVFDDFVADTAAAYAATVEFLGAPPDGRSDFPVVNERKQVRLAPLARLLNRPPPVVSRMIQRAKRASGLEGVGLLDFARRFNTVPRDKGVLPVALREEMIEVFREDVERLSSTVGRDLSHWLAAGSSSGPDRA